MEDIKKFPCMPIDLDLHEHVWTCPMCEHKTRVLFHLPFDMPGEIRKIMEEDKEKVLRNARCSNCNYIYVEM